MPDTTRTRIELAAFLCSVAATPIARMPRIAIPDDPGHRYALVLRLLEESISGSLRRLAFVHEAAQNPNYMDGVEFDDDDLRKAHDAIISVATAALRMLVYTAELRGKSMTEVAQEMVEHLDHLRTRVR